MSNIIYVIYESACNVCLDAKNKVIDSGCMYVDKIRGYSESREGAIELMRRIRDYYCNNSDVAWDYKNDMIDHITRDFAVIEDEYNQDNKYGKSYYLRTKSTLTEVILP